MKKVFLLWAALSLWSCSNNDDEANLSPSPQVNQLETNLKDGTWRVSRFVDAGKDETSDFNGFAFVFQNDGNVSVRANSREFVGTWSITDDNSNDDSNELSDLDFNLQFNLSNALEELTDDWDIVSQSSTELQLQSVSGGNGDTDLLTFTKN